MKRKRKASPITKLAYFIKEGFASIFTHSIMSLAAVTVIAACLLITATFMLVSYNIDVQIGKLQNNDMIVVYIDDSFTREQALAIEDKITALDNVLTADFVSKEDFFDSFVESQGKNAAIFESMRDDNPLRDSYHVIMKDISKHAETLAALESIEGIADSNSDVELSERLVQLRSVIKTVSYTLIVLLGAVSLFIISNTVRLAMFSRRDEISVMKVVGATNGFIRAPFVVEGIILGVAAAVFVFAAQWLVYNYLVTKIGAGTSVIEMVDFETFRYKLAGYLLLAGVLLGVGGSVISIRRFMRV